MLLVLALELTLSASSPREAEAAFRLGRNLLQEGKIAEACAAFEQSNRLDPALGTLLNLAECEATLGRHARAYGLFQEVLAWSRRTQNAAREKVALERLVELKPRVALIVVDAVPAAEVRIDGQVVIAGSQVPVDVGPHEVTVTEGERALKKTVQAKGGESAAVALTPEPEPVVEPKTAALVPAPREVPPPAAAPVTVQTEGPRKRSVVGPALLITGGVLLVAGLVGTVWSASIWDRVQRQQPGGPSFDQPTVTESEFQRASVVYPASLVVTGLGAVLAAGGAVFLFTGSF